MKQRTRTTSVEHRLNINYANIYGELRSYETATTNQIKAALGLQNSSPLDVTVRTDRKSVQSTPPPLQGDLFGVPVQKEFFPCDAVPK